MFRCEDVCNDVIMYKRADYNNIDRKIDKILTSKIYGFPIMILFLSLLFWITIVFANYPSKMLFSFFNFLESKLVMLLGILNSPQMLSSILIMRNI
jgi:ferrous iron transport protein B